MIYIVERTFWANNDMQYDSEQGTDATTELVGVFPTREEAQAALELVDTYAVEERGNFVHEQEDYDGSLHSQEYGWWKSAGKCWIREVETGKVLVSAPDPEAVVVAVAYAKEIADREAEHRAKTEETQRLCVFFNDHGADRHLDFLCLDLVAAGCRTLEDVTNMGANEFTKLIGYSSSRLSTSSQKQQGLRDFQAAIARGDFRMSANHARHRQPGGWAAGPVAGY